MSKSNSIKLKDIIFKTENEIKTQINESNNYNKNNFRKYGLLNANWFKNNLSNLTKNKKN